MAPNSTVTTVLETTIGKKEQPVETKPKASIQFVWESVIFYPFLHISALYGMYLIFTSAKISTTIFAMIIHTLSGLGITAGAHRLWAHRSYKAKLPLRIILATFNLIAFQHDIYQWSRDHRVHHKHSETDADPYNASRGFFFSHMGWLMVRKHPEVINKGRDTDMSDLEADPVVMFQRKYYLILMPIFCFILPTIIPMYLWNETFANSWFVAAMFRYALTLHGTWLVNSAAHLYGTHPYDKNINPAENLVVALGALGEGWHNYHHVFPWDYKTSELGKYSTNFTLAFIDFFAKIGWAYDLKTVPADVIERRAKRTGDGTYVLPHHDGQKVWGWGDKDLTEEDVQTTVIYKKES